MTIQLREWGQLSYSDPEVVLVGIREIEMDPQMDSLPGEVRRLRTGNLKELREARLAALFSFGMSRVLGVEVFVAPGEGSDYDFVTAWKERDTLCYTPVQLKELPPSDLNARITLRDLERSLRKYSPTETALAVHLNRLGEIPLDDLKFPGSPFSEVWFFWCGSSDQNQWYLWGEPLQTVGPIGFEYPT